MRLSLCSAPCSVADTKTGRQEIYGDGCTRRPVERMRYRPVANVARLGPHCGRKRGCQAQTGRRRAKSASRECAKPCPNVARPPLASKRVPGCRTENGPANHAFLPRPSTAPHRLENPVEVRVLSSRMVVAARDFSSVCCLRERSSLPARRTEAVKEPFVSERLKVPAGVVCPFPVLIEPVSSNHGRVRALTAPESTPQA
jgi:hypothetical protein